MTRPLYVIPDIHGHADKLARALRLIEAEGGAEAPIVFLGDYVDRGPDSAGVIQTLVDGLDEGRDWILLRGNHEQMMLDALDAQKPVSRWLISQGGAAQTLASYGVGTDEDWRSAIPEAHIALLRATRLCHETPDLFLAHAGLRPGVALTRQSADDLMWIRDAFLWDGRDHGKLAVHGHSPVDWPEHHGNRVALDGGAGWGRPLHVAVFEGRHCWLLTESGRERLLPNR